MANSSASTDRREQRLNRMQSRGIASRKRVDLQNELAWDIGLTQTKRAAQLSKQALSLAKKLGYQRGIAYSLRNLGYCHLLFSSLEKALDHSYGARDIFVKLEETAGEASALDNVALIMWRLGSYDSALQTAFTSLSLHKQTGSEREQAWSLYNIGAIYFDIGEDDPCIKHFRTAQKLFKKIGYPVGQSRVYNGLAEVFRRQGELQKALNYHERSLSIAESYQIQLGISTSLAALGGLYLELKELEKAEYYHRLSLKSVKKLASLEIRAQAYAGYAALQKQTGKSDKACDLLQSALKLSIKANAKPTILRIRRELADLYESLGDYETALEHHKAFGLLREAIFGDQSKTKLRNLEISNNTAQAEREAEILRLKNEELAATVRQLKQAQKKLIQANKMASLGNLIAGFAHEMQEPLAVLAQYGKKMNRDAAYLDRKIRDRGNGLTPKLKGSIRIIADNNQHIQSAQQRIAAMIGSLTSFTQSEKISPDHIDLHAVIDGTLRLIFAKKDSRIKLIRDYGSLPAIQGYFHLLSQLFMTVLINAREAIDQVGEIRVATSVDKKNVQIAISDSGRGIPPDKLAKIFEIGFSQKDTRIRMHMGLANSYNIVQKHRGEIEVDSVIGSGTVVRIRLPIQK